MGKKQGRKKKVKRGVVQVQVLTKGGFSGKKKKEYLKKKRERKKQAEGNHNTFALDEEDEEVYQPVPKKKFVSVVTNEDHKLRSFFVRETDQEIQRQKMQSLVKLNRKKLKEMKIEDYEAIELPMLSKLNFGIGSGSGKDGKVTEDDLKFRKAKKKAYFIDYVERIEKKYNSKEFNYFERNVNVWNELWKVFEISDLFFVLVDVRHPVLHFPESLKTIIVNRYKKPLILVLNKVDLVEEYQKKSWLKYLKEKYPDVRIVEFSSFYSPKKKKKVVNQKGILELWDICKSVTDKKYSKWWDALKDLTHQRIKYRGKVEILKESRIDNPLKIGVIGHPNTGKSTLINTLLMDHKATTSISPGKTKKIRYFFLSKEIVLVDSPGIIFPIVGMPRELQVLTGLFPISQVRVPYYVVKYLAERVKLEEVLKLTLPDTYDAWSAMAICEAFAEKKDFKTKRLGRNDGYRAANFILREVLIGQNIRFNFYPPNVKPPKEDSKKKAVETDVKKSKKAQKEEEFWESFGSYT